MEVSENVRKAMKLLFSDDLEKDGMTRGEARQICDDESERLEKEIAQILARSCTA